MVVVVRWFFSSREKLNEIRNGFLCGNEFVIPSDVTLNYRAYTPLPSAIVTSLRGASTFCAKLTSTSRDVALLDPSRRPFPFPESTGTIETRIHRVLLRFSLLVIARLHSLPYYNRKHDPPVFRKYVTRSDKPCYLSYLLLPRSLPRLANGEQRDSCYRRITRTKGSDRPKWSAAEDASYEDDAGRRKGTGWSLLERDETCAGSAAGTKS